MAAFASSDVTVTITTRGIVGRKKQIMGTIAFGNGALTYASGGVPLPAISAFGMSRNIDELNVWGITSIANDYLVRYNKADHKLLMYEEESTAAGGPPPECDASEAPAARTYNFTAYGW